MDRTELKDIHLAESISKKKKKKKKKKVIEFKL